jgi:hypothetical protein
VDNCASTLGHASRLLALEWSDAITTITSIASKSNATVSAITTITTITPIASKSNATVSAITTSTAVSAVTWSVWVLQGLLQPIKSQVPGFWRSRPTHESSLRSQRTHMVRAIQRQSYMHSCERIRQICLGVEQ